MKRRELIKQAALLGIAAHPLVKAFGQRSESSPAFLQEAVFGGLKKPVFVYNNWSAYDELSDNVPQTELLALRAQSSTPVGHTGPRRLESGLATPDQAHHTRRSRQTAMVSLEGGCAIISETKEKKKKCF